MRTNEDVIEELENYMRDMNDYNICRACGSPMDAANGMAAHDELCPLGIVLIRLREGWKHDCEHWQMEGVACANCNPAANG